MRASLRSSDVPAAQLALMSGTLGEPPELVPKHDTGESERGEGKVQSANGMGGPRSPLHRRDDLEEPT